MSKRELVAKFCYIPQGNCPAVYLDRDANPSRQIVITDDFNNEIIMSRQQFEVFIKKAQKGELKYNP